MSFFAANRFKAAVVGMTLLSGLAAGSADAAPILVFGQIGLGTPITGTATGSTTVIRTTDTPINISGIDAPVGSVPLAYLSFVATSTDLATIGVDGNVRQNFVGTFSIFSGMNMTGTNYLSGGFTDLFEGLNASGTLLASTPPASNVTFTSGVIPASDLGLDRAVSFSFTSVSPGIVTPTAGGTIPSFTAAISGNFSAGTTRVPEPASLALLGSGLIGLGWMRRKHK